MNDKDYNTNYNSLNRDIRIMGLKVYHSLALFVLAIVLGLANIPVLIGYLFVALLLVDKVKKEQRRGVPDYIKSLLVKNSSPKEILADNVFENIEK